jgi:hypothetical protein
MAADLVSAATSENLIDLDLTKSIKICELVASDHRQAKDVVKAIKKLVVSKNSTTQLFTVMLLEMLMNNIGEPIYKQVIDTGLLPILVKIVKKKARERIFLLLDATQTSLSGASGRFPQYYSAYYELVSLGVEFPQRPRFVSNSNNENLVEHKRNSNVSTNAREIIASSGNQRNVLPKAKTMQLTITDSGTIIQKASAALEVLREVISVFDTKNPEAAKDEFTLDLVEQCSFQKQRVMHLAMTSRDDKTVSQAIELNEQLDKVLKIHDLLVSGNSTSTIPTQSNKEDEEEEEEAEQLFRRLRKGKGCAKEEKEDVALRASGLQLEERLHRPLIIRTQIEEDNNDNNRINVGVTSSSSLSNGRIIPPPPAKHVERERFFHEANNNKGSNGDSLSGHVRGVSLHTCTPSTTSRTSLDSDDSY